MRQNKKVNINIETSTSSSEYEDNLNSISNLLELANGDTPILEQWIVDSVSSLSNRYNLSPLYLSGSIMRSVPSISEEGFFESGEVVVVGYYRNSRNRPLILGPGSIRKVVESFKPIKGWTTYLQNPERQSWGEAKRVEAVDSFVGGFSTGHMTRIFGGKIFFIYSNDYTGTGFNDEIWKVDPSSPDTPELKYIPGCGIVDFIVDPDTGDLIVAEWEGGSRLWYQFRRGWGHDGSSWNTRSRVTRLSGSNFSVIWSTPWSDNKLIKPAPSLLLVPDGIWAICDLRVGSDYRTYLGAEKINYEDGTYLEPIFKLDYTNLPSVALSRNELPPPHGSGTQNLAYWAGTQDYSIDRLDFPEEKFNSNRFIGIYPYLASSQYNVFDFRHQVGTINMQQDSSSLSDNTTWYGNLLLTEGLFIPCPRRGMNVSAFSTVDGSRMWERKSFSSNQAEVYTPLLAHLGKILVHVEKYGFTEGSFSHGYVSARRTYNPSGADQWEIESENSGTNFQYRVITKRLTFLEVWDSRTGNTISSREIGDTNKITGHVCLPLGGPNFQTWELESPPSEESTTTPTSPWSGQEIASRGNETIFPVFFKKIASGSEEYPEDYTLDVAQLARWSGHFIGGHAGGLKAISHPDGGFTLYNSGFRAYWSAQIVPVEISGPTLFDPYICGLSSDGRQIIFAPSWHPYWKNDSNGNTPTVNAGFPQIGQPSDDPWQAAPEFARDNSVWMSAYDWSLNLEWEHEIPFNSPPDDFTNSHPVAMGFLNASELPDSARIMIHYRVDDKAYFREIGCAAGELLSEESIDNVTVANTPFANWDQWGETGQQVNAQTVPSLLTHTSCKEVLYAGKDFYVTKDRGSIIVLRAEPEV